MNPSITAKAAKGWFLGQVCDATIETGSPVYDARLEIFAFLNRFFDAKFERCIIRAHAVVNYNSVYARSENKDIRVLIVLA